MARVLVERIFDAPMSFDAVAETEARASFCLETHRVVPVRSWLASDGLSMVCEYDAPDAESVRLSQEKAGLPFVRIFEADRVTYRGR